MTFYKVISEAITDLTLHGYDSQARVDQWVMRIRSSAQQSLIPANIIEKSLRSSLLSSYNKAIKHADKKHKGIPRFTVERLKPSLRKELDRRMVMSASLIKLNREQAIETTLRRFQGWASSIPEGGSKVVDKADESKHIRKALASLPFEERRVAIDQGHKLAATINDVIAVGGGAIAARWRSHWRQPGYDFREPHKHKDQAIYTIRGNWALEKGLMRVGENGYTDHIEQPAELPFCRCYYVYLYNLRDLPDEMVTAKGRETINSK